MAGRVRGRGAGRGAIANGPRALDTGLGQVVINFGDEETAEDEYEWNGRLLVVKSNDARWIAVDPDGHAEFLDLSSEDYDVVPLRRRALLPARVTDSLWWFDADITKETLDDWIAGAHQLAAIMGVGPAAAAAGASKDSSWRMADPARAVFGDEVPVQSLGEGDQTLVKGSVALVRLDDEDGKEAWSFAERVRDQDFETWKDAKRSGPGRDYRLASYETMGKAGRTVALKKSLTLFRPQQFTDWPFGATPSAAMELLTSISKTGHELATYDGFWTARCGISKGSAVAIAHRNVFVALGLLQSYDQVDLANLAGAEYLCRWILQIQTAVRRNSKVPSFEGLEPYLAHSYDESGGATVSLFSKHIASIEKDQAAILRQRRLWSEESKQEKSRMREKTEYKSEAPTRGQGGAGKGGAPTRAKPKKKAKGDKSAPAADAEEDDED